MSLRNSCGQGQPPGHKGWAGTLHNTDSVPAECALGQSTCEWATLLPGVARPRGWKHLKVEHVHRTFCNTGAHKGCPGAWARPAGLPGAHPWGCQDALSRLCPGTMASPVTHSGSKVDGTPPPAHSSSFPGREAAAGGARSPKDSRGQGGAPAEQPRQTRHPGGLPALALLASYSTRWWSLLRNSDIRAHGGQSPFHACSAPEPLGTVMSACGVQTVTCGQQTLRRASRALCRASCQHSRTPHGQPVSSGCEHHLQFTLGETEARRWYQKALW